MSHNNFFIKFLIRIVSGSSKRAEDVQGHQLYRYCKVQANIMIKILKKLFETTPIANSDP